MPAITVGNNHVASVSVEFPQVDLLSLRKEVNLGFLGTKKSLDIARSMHVNQGRSGVSHFLQRGFTSRTNPGRVILSGRLVSLQSSSTM